MCVVNGYNHNYNKIEEKNLLEICVFFFLLFLTIHFDNLNCFKNTLNCSQSHSKYMTNNFICNCFRDHMTPNVL